MTTICTASTITEKKSDGNELALNPKKGMSSLRQSEEKFDFSKEQKFFKVAFKIRALVNFEGKKALLFSGRHPCSRLLSITCCLLSRPIQT